MTSVILRTPPRPETRAPRPRKKAPKELARVYVLNPRTIGILDALTSAGTDFEIRWTGSSLSIVLR